jgi:ankyrin repeat protein
MTLIEALVPAAIQKRTGLWESQEQDLWAHLMRMLQIQGFTDHNSYDVSCAAAILHKLGLHITDPYQKKRLLHVLHFLYLPNVSVITLDNLDLDITHRKTLRELLEVQPAFWGFISLFESAHYRLQQCLVERNVEALQKYIVSYSILHEKYGDINSAEVPLLKRLLEEDSLGYQLWGLNRDYENVVHQCLKDGWYQGLLVLVSAATSTSPFIGQCPHFNQRDRFGDAPIHLAARSINLLAVSRLLQVPAVDVTATDRGGKNVLHLLFLRIQIRWNRFRPGAGASAHREAAGTPRLEPGEHEVVEVAEQVLEKAESAPDLLLQEDKTGLSVLDYALGLRSNRLLLVLLHRIDHNTSTQYLDTAHRMQLLIGLLRSAVLLNQYDLVYTLARLVLKLNQNLLLRLAATPVKGGSPLKTRVPDGVVKEETLVDLVLLCLQEGLATSLQALVSVTPVGEGDPTFASCINRRGTETGTWLSSGRGGTEDTRAVRIVNCGYPQQYPLQLAVRRAAMHDMSTAGVSTKVGKAGDDPLGLPGNAGAAVVFAVSMVRTLIRAGAKVLVVLPQLRDEMWSCSACWSWQLSRKSPSVVSQLQAEPLNDIYG